MTKRLLTMAEICELYRVTRYTIRRWYKAGALPAPIRIGRGIRWRPDQIEGALATPAEVEAALTPTHPDLDHQN